MSSPSSSSSDDGGGGTGNKRTFDDHLRRHTGTNHPERGVVLSSSESDDDDDDSDSDVDGSDSDSDVDDDDNMAPPLAPAAPPAPPAPAAAAAGAAAVPAPAVVAERAPKRARAAGGDSDDEDYVYFDAAQFGREAPFDCIVCKTSFAMQAKNELPDAWLQLRMAENQHLHGVSDEGINVLMHRIWNTEIRTLALARKIYDIPELSVDYMRRHRQQCRVKSVDQMLLAYIRDIDDLIQSLKKTRLYKRRRLGHGLFGEVVADRKSTARMQTLLGVQCKLVQQLRGPVSSSHSGGAAYEKQYAQKDRENRARAAVKASQASGGMRVTQGTGIAGAGGGGAGRPASGWAASKH
jgi:hypothetical protein